MRNSCLKILVLIFSILSLNMISCAEKGIISLNTSNTLRFWDITSGELVKSITNEKFKSIFFFEIINEKLFTISFLEQSKIYIWTIKKLDVQLDKVVELNNNILSLNYLRFKNKIAVGFVKGLVGIYSTDLSNQELDFTSPLGQDIIQVEDIKGDYVACRDRNESVTLFNTATKGIKIIPDRNINGSQIVSNGEINRLIMKGRIDNIYSLSRYNVLNLERENLDFSYYRILYIKTYDESIIIGMTEDSTYAIEFSTLKLKNLFTNYPTLKKINDLSFASFKSDLIKIWNIDSEKPIQTLSLHEEFANFVVINLNYNEESLGFLTD